MQLQDKLKTLFETRLQQGSADLETLPNGHVSGYVVSSEFDGCDYEQRRQKIRAIVRRAEQDGTLSPQDVLNISTLLTYTPAEWSVALTDIQ